MGDARDGADFDHGARVGIFGDAGIFARSLCRGARRKFLFGFRARASEEAFSVCFAAGAGRRGDSGLACFSVIFSVIRAILAMRCIIQFVGQAVGLMLLHRRWKAERLAVSDVAVSPSGFDRDCRLDWNFSFHRARADASLAGCGCGWVFLYIWVRANCCGSGRLRGSAMNEAWAVRWFLAACSAAAAQWFWRGARFPGNPARRSAGGNRRSHQSIARGHAHPLHHRASRR